MNEPRTTEKSLTNAAKAVSVLFTPLAIPFVAFLVLFGFSYLRILPTAYKLTVLGVVGCSTLLMPATAIALYRKLCGPRRGEVVPRSRRLVPFLLTLASQGGCLGMMRCLHLPWYMHGIVLAALLTTTVCTTIGLRWKLSGHMAGVGTVLGGLTAFSALFGFNPTGWLCAVVLVAGMVGTARIILDRHTTGEVMGGLVVGLLCTLWVLHPTCNGLFRHMLC